MPSRDIAGVGKEAVHWHAHGPLNVSAEGIGGLHKKARVWEIEVKGASDVQRTRKLPSEDKDGRWGRWERVNKIEVTKASSVSDLDYHCSISSPFVRLMCRFVSLCPT